MRCGISTLIPNVIYVVFLMHGTSVNPGFLGLSFRLHFMLIQLWNGRPARTMETFRLYHHVSGTGWMSTYLILWA